VTACLLSGRVRYAKGDLNYPTRNSFTFYNPAENYKFLVEKHKAKNAVRAYI
jgi:hypothetical protein